MTNVNSNLTTISNNLNTANTNINNVKSTVGTVNTNISSILNKINVGTSVIRSIQRGEIDWAETGTIKTITIKAVNVNKSFILILAHENSTALPHHAYFTSSTQLTFKRGYGGTSSRYTFGWRVIEFV